MSDSDSKINKSLQKRRKMQILEEKLEELELYENKEWSVFQDMALEIESQYTIQQKKLTVTEMIRQMKLEAKHRFEEYPEVLEEVLELIPSNQAVSQWRNTKKWQPAIWGKCKSAGLFTKERKAQVIEKIFQRVMERGDTNAAKLWLTLSGDYVEKSEVKSDATVDTFREINQILHKKNEK